MIKIFEGLGSGQGSRARILVSPRGKEIWIKPKKTLPFKPIGSSKMGLVAVSKAGSGIGFKPNKPKELEKIPV